LVCAEADGSSGICSLDEQHAAATDTHPAEDVTDPSPVRISNHDDRVVPAWRFAMWVWMVVVVVVIVLVVAAVLAVQARRRRGGVIVDPGHPVGRRRRDSS
jgi:hypothetical protein